MRKQHTQTFENPLFLVAGHICVDLIPALSSSWPQPGSLLEAGPLYFSMGGAVSNVGAALSRLGFPVRMAGLVGDDRLGAIALQLLQPLGEQPGIRVAPGQSTSYSVVIAPHNSDRAFLHCIGANLIFTSSNVRDEDMEGASWLHCGYPPILPKLTADGGEGMVSLFSRARQKGLRTSLDLCSIGGVAALVDWETVLSSCASHITVFAPSIDELRTAMRQPAKEEVELDEVRSLAGRLVDMGFTIVLIKLGTQGLYLVTTADMHSLELSKFGRDWCSQELFAPCFRAKFVNATGAGDCTIAGFIASIAAGCAPERALTIAAACGASSVEAPDASSGVPSMSELDTRMRSGWPRMKHRPPAPDWIYDPNLEIWHHRRVY